MTKKMFLNISYKIKVLSDSHCQSHFFFPLNEYLHELSIESEKVKVKSLSHVWLLVTPWTVTCQAPLSMGFSREEYWSGIPQPSSRGSSGPRDRIFVSCSSCIVRRWFFTTDPLGEPRYVFSHITQIITAWARGIWVP